MERRVVLEGRNWLLVMKEAALEERSDVAS
jgi:hypothetical protein